MSPEEAKEFGLIDEIVESRSKEEEDSYAPKCDKNRPFSN